jgi:hypothetical protein
MSIHDCLVKLAAIKSEKKSSRGTGLVMGALGGSFAAATGSRFKQIKSVTEGAQRYVAKGGNNVGTAERIGRISESLSKKPRRKATLLGGLASVGTVAGIRAIRGRKK